MKDIVTMYAGIRDSMSHIIARLVFRKSDYGWLKQNLHLFRVRKDTLLFCRFQELTNPVFTWCYKVLLWFSLFFHYCFGYSWMWHRTISTNYISSDKFRLA